MATRSRFFSGMAAINSPARGQPKSRLEETMTTLQSPRSMTRRQLLTSGTAMGAALVVGPGFVMHSTEAWAAEAEQAGRLMPR